MTNDPRAAREYEAARRGAAVIPIPWRSLLAVRGRDAVAFLNGMLTQDLLQMSPGETLPACQVDRRGHLIADLYLHRLDDGGLIDLPAERLAIVTALYEKHRIMERLRIEPMTETRAVGLLGPEASSVLERIEEAGWPVQETADAGFRVWRADPSDLIDRATKAGAEPIGDATWERLRIEAGTPRYGREMDETHLPQEVGMDAGISTSKGCYLGQETLARLHFRGHVNRSLYGVRIPGPAPAVGAEVRIDGETVGMLTSVAGPPGSGDSLGLLLLRTDRQEQGRVVEVDGLRGFLESLPFREARHG